jgi:hypothetical protein
LTTVGGELLDVARANATAAGRREAFHRAYVADCGQFREDARVLVPRERLLIVGRRR